MSRWREPLPDETRCRIEALLPGSPTRHLISVVQQARNAEGEEREEWAASLNALLSRPPPKDTEAWGFTLIEFLEDGAFEGMEDEDGIQCRTCAVEAVLALGYPWALHLTPEDVDRVRDNQWRGKVIGSLIGGAAILCGLAVFVYCVFI